MKDLNSNLVLAILAGSFGSAFQHGYNTGVLNAPQKVITDWIAACRDDPQRHCLDDYSVTLIWSWVVAIFCIGGMMGGTMVGFVSSKFGRKGGLLVINILVVIGSLLMAFAKLSGNYQMLLAGRLVIGINSGLNAGLSPMYLSEISPQSLRGSTGTVYQLIITLSILLSQLLGMGQVLGTPDRWPYLLGLTLIPGVLQVAMLPFCPESPRYLFMDKMNYAAAETALKWIRKTDNVELEMMEMKAELATIRNTQTVTLKEMLTNKVLRRPLVIAMMMMLAQQLTGINAAMFFSTKIFLSAGLDESSSQYASVGMGVMNVLMTFISMILIDVAGRKTLMLAGLGGMLISTTILLVSLVLADTYSWIANISILGVILFVVGFATGPGSIPWFFVTELFAQSGRPIATSIAVAVNWSANFLVGLLFSPVLLAIGPYVFVIFIVIQAFFIFYVQFFCCETKNKSIEEVTAQFQD